MFDMFSMSRSDPPPASPPHGGKILRHATPNERRCIVREDLGYYNALAVGGIYCFEPDLETTSVDTFIPALRICVAAHAPLSAIPWRVETEAPVYVQVPTVDLAKHITIFTAREDSHNRSDVQQIEDALPAVLDTKWALDVPAWKLVVLPIKEAPDPSLHRPTVSRCYVALVFAHSFGDGISGMAFHRTFLDAMNKTVSQNQAGQDHIVPGSTVKYPEPFDTPQRLPISWSFLMSPLLAVYLPKRFASALGLRAAVGTVTPGTWIATPISYNPEDHRTALKLLEIDSALVAKALQQCRQHGAKLTGLLHELIIRSLSQNLPGDATVDNFVSQTAMNMRGAVDVSNNQMGLFVSGYVQSHPRPPSTPDLEPESIWTAARSMTESLASSARNLQDQAIGLLRFLPSIRAWTLGKAHGPRDASYEVSNLLAFDGPSSRGTGLPCYVQKMVFAQPANVTGAPLAFNVASVKGGSLVCAVAWQIGALGMDEDSEGQFVAAVCATVEDGLRKLTA